MGLDVVTLGATAMAPLLKSPNEVPELAILVQSLIDNFPDAMKSLDVGEPDLRLAEGLNVGGYSSLHKLRGLAIMVMDGRQAIRDAGEDELDQAAESYYSSGRSGGRFRHLLDHPDSEGYYVPIEFNEPLVIDGQRLADGLAMTVVAGSSQGLLKELIELGTWIELDKGGVFELTEGELTTLFNQHRWPNVAYAWLVLIQAVRESVSKSCFLQFC
jgi:hypothetical protein